MVRTTADEVRAELQVSADDYPSIDDDGIEERQILDRWRSRAHTLVSRRIPDETDEEHLTELEVLVSAHFAYFRLVGAESGMTVDSVQKADATINVATADATEGVSPFWRLAVTLDPRLQTDDDSREWFVEVANAAESEVGSLFESRATTGSGGAW